jgi:hypothetical protein
VLYCSLIDSCLRKLHEGYSLITFINVYLTRIGCPTDTATAVTLILRLSSLKVVLTVPTVSALEVMPWGQTIAYVADINGFLVALCTPMG